MGALVEVEIQKGVVTVLVHFYDKLNTKSELFLYPLKYWATIQMSDFVGSCPRRPGETDVGIVEFYDEAVLE